MKIISSIVKQRICIYLFDTIIFGCLQNCHIQLLKNKRNAHLKSQQNSIIFWKLSSGMKVEVFCKSWTMHAIQNNHYTSGCEYIE